MGGDDPGEWNSFPQEKLMDMESRGAAGPSQVFFRRKMNLQDCRKKRRRTGIRKRICAGGMDKGWLKASGQEQEGPALLSVVDSKRKETTDIS